MIEMSVKDQTRPAEEATKAGDPLAGEVPSVAIRSAMHPQVMAAAFRAAKALGVEDELQRKLELPPE